MKYKIKITKQKIDINEVSTIFNNQNGANVIFLGTIKCTNNSKKVKNIFYMTFKDLFISLFKKKCHHLLSNKSKTKIYIIQAAGLLNVGYINSIIAVSSINRQEAFYMCRELVETLKYNAPVWKKELYLDGSIKWLNA